ncbi:MAG: hypothetical protein ACD_11C00029G0009 [uncultured bacterium]|nr:MAG: hypothetical protein ACD_11C00029G0009 [uncultured bacterium]HBR71837.1 type I methionyl aminopeptidase [Candidatus Moranbacteria bacterium]
MFSIKVKNEKEIGIMREAGKKLLSVMDNLAKEVRSNVSTYDLDKLAEELVFSVGGKPAFKGYGEKRNPFPATICASINNEVVHGVPRKEKILKEGDIFKIDIGMKYQGYFVDMARTFAVGKISKDAQSLMDATRECFWVGIENIKSGSKLSDFSKAVESYIKSCGYSVVRNLVGHGIGEQLHEDPQVPNFFDPKMIDYALETGNTLALEPMVNQGDHRTKIGKDGWVFETADGKLSAHYENTILITDDGVEVLTN